MFDLVAGPTLKAASHDDSVPVALEGARAYEALRPDFIPRPLPVTSAGDPESGIMFG
ncbi:hypothetical protein ABZ897_53395 [Nonomuraea sp. NPDC046802]|uniref:hypothetical protein n=1 Tax=Nonomuraea sp. NPDC046802 TaxID=3154919 RepID=UPI0033F1099E